jgi:Holliday junction resolvase RusA-like endonuclease
MQQQKQQFCKIVFWTSDGILGDVKVVFIKKQKQKPKKVVTRPDIDTMTKKGLKLIGLVLGWVK